MSSTLTAGVFAVMLAVLSMLASTVTSTAHAQPAHASPSIDTSKPWTRKAAFQASEGRIVLHYGEEGIREISARLEAESLSDSGYPAIAVPGGLKGAVEMFVGEKIIGKYDQDQLDTSFVGFLAMRFYEKFFKKTSNLNRVPQAK